MLNIIYVALRMCTHTHWALEQRGDSYVTNIENLHIGLKLLCLMVKDFHESHGTVFNIFWQNLRDLPMKI